MPAHRPIVFIDPPSRHLEGDRLFDAAAQANGGPDTLVPYAFLRRWLRERGLHTHTADYLHSSNGTRRSDDVYISLGMRDRFQKLYRREGVVLSAFFALECPVVEPRLYRDLDRIGTAFRRVFSYSTAEALAPFLRRPVRLERFSIPQCRNDVDHQAWSRDERRFLTIINANKVPRVSVNELYTERLRATAFFHQFGEIDLYGIGWEGPPFRVGETRTPRALRRVMHRARTRWQRLRPPSDPLMVAARAAYRGPVASKLDVLSHYTFAICFENSILEGWITEKIFDCFYAGTVPVYWGAPDVQERIPPECFVDMRRFANYSELRHFLFSLSPREVDDYRVAARDFLSSERYRPFSKEAFAELVGGIVAEDAGVSL